MSFFAHPPTEALSLWILSNWVHDDFGSGQFVYSTAILRSGPPSVRNKVVLDQCITTLVKAGQVRPVNGGVIIGGAIRRRVWEVVAP
jgi:hypothetical protein